MMARHDAGWYRQATARDGAGRDARGYETNADDPVGCVGVVTVDDVVDAFTRYGWTDPPAAADLDADLGNDEGMQP
jgi:hypothetical protein